VITGAGRAVSGWVPPASVTGVPYAGLGLDRVTGLREDAAWVAAQAADPRARVLPLWCDQALVTGDPPALRVLRPRDVGQDRLLLLGLADGVPWFAADLSDLAIQDALVTAGADDAADTRSLFTGLPAAQAGMLAYARGLLYWNRHQRYCGRCGCAAEPRNGGLLRACTNAECGTLLFPRIEPAVITLVETITPPRRCLLARHRAAKAGGYSLLAGFVEIGESLEDAVRREIFEEAGVVLRDIGYVGSQPWPYPAGIMAGFRATAADESVSVDGSEIQEARWFTGDELRDYGETGGRLGRVDSIDRIMLTAWLAEGDAAALAGDAPAAAQGDTAAGAASDAARGTGKP
jgi:NAD+ diphosphatase